MADEKTKKQDEEILDTAKERFKNAQDAWNDPYREALDDLKFRAGEQWPQELLASRKSKKRPVLTINKIPQFVRQISNEMRQNRPAIKVYPVDDNADIDTAKILSGVVRNIEYSSNADVAYNSAGEGAVEKSFGFFRITTEYSDPNSFDQVIKIKPIANHFSVFIDPSSQELDGSDANWAFVFDEVSKYELKAQYPYAEINDSDWGELSNNNADWFSKEKCRIAEYYYKEFTKVKIYKVQGLDGIETTETKPEDESLILDERDTLKPVVKWCKIVGCEILERTEWLGSYIPIIPVYGSRYYMDGRWHLESVFRQAKDSQRMFNYMKSYEAEAIGRTPKAPFMVAEGQIPKGYEQMWKSANTEDYPYLVYKPTDHNGTLVGPPQRQQFEPAIQAITQASMLASDDIKATTGIYDASLGARSNEQSGVAIQRRNIQAQTSNYHFVDNQAISIRHCGRQIVELIPKIYTEETILRMIGEDGSPDFAKVNGFDDKKQKNILLGAGKYDVVVDVGPSYATKRQESAQNLLDLMAKIPGQAPLIADLAVKNLDFPDAQALADRLKKALPPQFQDTPQQQIPPEVQQMMAQTQQEMQQLQQQNQAMSQIIANKQQELDVKLHIEQMKIESQEKIELAKLHNKEALEVLTHEMEMIKLQQSKQDQVLNQFEIENEESGADAGSEGMNGN
jgi:hypothetical protein